MNDSSKFACIEGFAEQYADVCYEGISNWFITFRSPFNVYSAHFSYLMVFCFIIICGLLSYRHAMENGNKYTLFWWGAFIHGLFSERGISSDKYWHAQAPIMFFGKQLPLHILFFYPAVIYTAMMAIQRLKLNIYTEPAAVGVLVMLMEIPFRMISVKFLHITYHDSDPLYYHRMCGVPWTEIFSGLLLTSSYVAVYHFAQFFLSRNISTIWDDSKATKDETVCALASGAVSPLVGFMQKLVFLHFFNDFFKVNPISCLVLTVSLYLCFVIIFDPSAMGSHEAPDTVGKPFLFYELAVFSFCLLFLALVGRPQKEISIGRHEPVGDCTTTVRARTPFGKEIKRLKFLCPKHVDSRPFFLYSFNCLPKGAPCLNAVWYTICGTPLRNRFNFFVMVLSFIMLVLSIFLRTMFPRFLALKLTKIFSPLRKTGESFEE